MAPDDPPSLAKNSLELRRGKPSTLVKQPASSGGAGPQRNRLNVLVADERGRRLPANGLASWLRRVAPAAARGTVSIALVSDTRVRTLNRTYRRKDYATDVLAFPYDEGGKAAPPAPSGLTGLRQGYGGPLKLQRRRKACPTRAGGNVATCCEPFLGEIVIARGVAKRQARDARHSELTELRVLTLHGLLHLLGYDHERDHGRMRRVELRLRRKGGLREGLIERR